MTDKAAAPINLYGATKCAQTSCSRGNNIRGECGLRFSVVRYGNVIVNRNSVIPPSPGAAFQGVREAAACR